MKKLLVSICVIAAGLMVPQTIHAQGILGKINKGLEKVNKALDKASDKANVAAGNAVDLGNGATMTNPVSKVMDVELVGLYGVSTSENFGNVEVILKVKMKEPETSVTFGGNAGSEVTIAYDADGNSYKMESSSVGESYDVEEGIPVKIVMNGRYAFQKVRKSATTFPVLKLFTHIAYSNGYRGTIVFKNVPIQWDVEH
ncbi:MAG: hypothetical protein IJV13_01710 [Prevotella sp.]|nr:hypothetical protein [Prevotella sp.]